MAEQSVSGRPTLASQFDQRPVFLSEDGWPFAILRAGWCLYDTESRCALFQYEQGDRRLLRPAADGVGEGGANRCLLGPGREISDPSRRREHLYIPKYEHRTRTSVGT